MVNQEKSRSAAPCRPAPAWDNGIKVIHGRIEGMFETLAGIPVEPLRLSLADAFAIPAESVSLVNGKRVGQDYLLRANDVLEFVSPKRSESGSKAVNACA